jgi:adenylylsulfate reductase subunit A
VQFKVAEHAEATIKEGEIENHIAEIEKFLSKRGGNTEEARNESVEHLEEAMQAVMDTYAGGIKTGYRYSENQLAVALKEIEKIETRVGDLRAADLQEVMFIYELKERLTVCKSVIAHLAARHETRWHSFAENLDYPEKDNVNFRKYVNSRLENGEIKIILRELTAEGQRNYEH